MKSKITIFSLMALLLPIFSVPSAEARGYTRVAYVSPTSTVRVQAATRVVPPVTTSVRAPAAPARITSTSNMQAIANRAAGLSQPITRNGEAMNTASYGRAIACSNCNNIQSRIVMPTPSVPVFLAQNPRVIVTMPAVTRPRTTTNTQPRVTPPRVTPPRVTPPRVTPPRTTTNTQPSVVTPTLPLASENNPNQPVFSGNTNPTRLNPGNRVITPPNNNNNLGGINNSSPVLANNNSNRVPQITTGQPTQNSTSNGLTAPNNSNPTTIPNLAPSGTTTNPSSQIPKFKVS